MAAAAAAACSVECGPIEGKMKLGGGCRAAGAVPCGMYEGQTKAAAAACWKGSVGVQRIGKLDIPIVTWALCQSSVISHQEERDGMVAMRSMIIVIITVGLVAIMTMIVQIMVMIVMTWMMVASLVMVVVRSHS